MEPWNRFRGMDSASLCSLVGQYHKEGCRTQKPFTEDPARRCNVSPSPTDLSLTKNSWMLHPLDKVSLGYFAPDRTIPSLNSDLIERSNTRLPTAVRFSAAKRWSFMCGPSTHPTEGRQPNKPGQGRRRSLPDAPLIHKAPEADRGRDSGRRSEFHACLSGPGLGHIGQGRNIQGMLCSRGLTSKNFRSGIHQPCIN
jgi:hypothetical protein